MEQSVNPIGRLILDVFTKRGFAQSITDPVQTLNDYGVTDESHRAMFVTAFAYPRLMDAVSEVWAAYDEGRANGAITEVQEPWGTSAS